MKGDGSGTFWVGLMSMNCFMLMYMIYVYFVLLMDNAATRMHVLPPTVMPQDPFLVQRP
jgi:hypothetical protein